MSTETFELNCPFCDKLYKLPREKVLKHAGKLIHCRKCGKPFSVPSLPVQEPVGEPALRYEEIPIAVVAEPPPEAAVVEAPVEPSPQSQMFAVSETIEPPALSEYESVPAVQDEDETPASSSSESETFSVTGTGTGLNEDPPSYFAPPEVTSETVELSGEPAFSMEHAQPPVNEIAIAQTRETDEARGVDDAVEDRPLQAFDDGGSEETVAEDEVHTELAPPPPTPPSSGARRSERISVKPVFDAAAEEEPVPRRRRFGRRAEAVAPVVEEIPTPVAKSEEAAVAAESPVVVVPHETLVEVSEAVVKEEIPELAAPGSDEGVISAGVRAAPMVVSEEVRGMLVGIRRAVMLLAVMSVIIAVVLIGVLLAIVGIIPKR